MLSPSRLGPRLSWLALALAAWMPVARADGVLRQGDRTVLRVRNAAPPCAVRGADCDAFTVRQLTGYRFLNGSLDTGARWQHDAQRLQSATVLGLAAARLLLPGGDFDFGQLTATAAGPEATVRLSFSAIDVRTALFCRDRTYGGLHGPLNGMLRYDCRPTQRWGLDASIAYLQWDHTIERLAAQWVELGPALELLANGHGYDRLQRSLAVALTADARSLYFDDREERAAQPTGFTVGADVAVRAFWRSPRWEVRTDARYRTVVAGGPGALGDHQATLDVLFVRNLVVGDAVVLRPGARFHAAYAEHPETALGPLASVESTWSGFAGLHVGVLHGALGI